MPHRIIAKGQRYTSNEKKFDADISIFIIYLKALIHGEIFTGNYDNILWQQLLHPALTLILLPSPNTYCRFF